MSVFSVKIEGLDEFKNNAKKGHNQLPRMVKNAMFKAVTLVKNEAQNNAPYKTGNLRRSIHAEVVDSGFKGVVYQNYQEASYGSAIEFGTSPHEIRPVTRQALFWKGALHPVKVVRHPGFPAKPYMQPALERNIDKIKQIFIDVLGDVVNILKK